MPRASARSPSTSRDKSPAATRKHIYENNFSTYMIVARRRAGLCQLPLHILEFVYFRGGRRGHWSPAAGAGGCS